jgi:ribose-phosphate pyrophosphokinase
MTITSVQCIPMERIKVLAGNAHPELALEICKCLGIQLGKADVGQFSNGETSVMISESIRDMDVFVIQPTCNPNPNDNLMELLVMADAIKRASGTYTGFGLGRAQ